MRFCCHCLLFCCLIVCYNTPRAQELTLPAPAPLLTETLSYQITSVTDARFEADPTFVGVGEIGLNLQKTSLTLRQPLAEWFDSLTQTLPPVSAPRHTISLVINRLGVLENNTSTSEQATLVAVFSFVAAGPDRDTLLDRRQIVTTYKGRDVTDKHTSRIQEALGKALSEYNAYLLATPGLPPKAIAESGAFFRPDLPPMIQDTLPPDGLYETYEAFLSQKPSQPVQTALRSDHPVIQYTEGGKTRHVRSTDPVWGVVSAGKLYIFDYGMFYPAQPEDARMLFSGFNPKHQLPSGVIYGILPAEPMGKPEARKPYVLDWQTGGFFVQEGYVKTQVIPFKRVPIPLERAPFCISTVIDARYMTDSAFLGVGYSGMYNAHTALSLGQALTTTLTQWFSEQLPEQPGLQPVVMRITRLGLGESFSLTTETAHLKAYIEWYLPESQGYRLLAQDTLYLEKNALDATSLHDNHFQIAMIQALQQLAVHVSRGVPSGSPLMLMAQLQQPPQPVTTDTSAWKPGVYKTFDDFLAQRPTSLASLEITHAGLRIMIQGENGKYRTMRPADEVWAVCHDQVLYLNQVGTFFPLYMRDNQLYFEGYDVISQRNNVATANIAFGLIGSLVAANSIRIRTYVIDWQTGYFYRAAIR
ncbi:MAG: hypothetical protein SF053_13775 [Bacteroidia bacterium]|nr:hypothetical protein [Bacteroidia bacterium]